MSGEDGLLAVAHRKIREKDFGIFDISVHTKVNRRVVYLKDVLAVLGEAEKHLQEVLEHFKIMACQICVICKGEMVMGSTYPQGMHYYCKKAMEEIKKSKWMTQSPEYPHFQKSERYVNEKIRATYQDCAVYLESKMKRVFGDKQP